MINKPDSPITYPDYMRGKRGGAKLADFVRHHFATTGITSVAGAFAAGVYGKEVQYGC